MSRKQKLTLSRIPKVLAEELEYALAVTDSLGESERSRLLAIHRRNRARCLADWGVLNVGSSVAEVEPMPLEHMRNIELLDKVFQKLHHFRSGGADDYTAIDVERAINSLRARGPRQQNNRYKDIADFLRKRRYGSSTNKKSLVAEAMSHFQISEPTVRRAIRAERLAKK